MDLDTFLHQLHYDIEKVTPPDWEIDWEDAPLTYKLYRSLPTFPLSAEVPLSLAEQNASSKPDQYRIGYFLWYTYGLTQVSQTVNTPEGTEHRQELMQSYRRFVPSGGALYPNEVYIYLKLEELPIGVYHYDVAHHRLVLLREGNFDSYISRALGNQCQLDACFGTVFVSTMFWKNFYKYHNFAYRLQGLDTGVLIGQCLEVAKGFGFEAGVTFQFLDRAINHLLGLAEQEESVYAVMPLSIYSTRMFSRARTSVAAVSAAKLCGELTPLQHNYYVRSQNVKEFPMINKLNQASFLDSTPFNQYMNTHEYRSDFGQQVSLPPVQPLDYDLASVCRKRYSPDMDFVLEKISLEQLATLLQESNRSFFYQNDLEGLQSRANSRVRLYGCFYNVGGIPDGAYYYDVSTHTLELINCGDHRLILQNSLSLHNVNLLQVPLSFHIIGDKEHYRSLGLRGYRIQQMEAGILLQRLLFTASAIGLGGHPLLGYDVAQADQLYRLEQKGLTSLIQIPIGSYRSRPWLRGGLHS